MVAVGLSAGLVAACRGPFSDEITIYWVTCPGLRDGLACSQPWQATGHRTFRASLERQEVLSWTEDEAVARRSTRCAVRDARNWSCPTPGGGREEMVDGRYRTSAGPGKGPWLIGQVPSHEWWQIKRGQEVRELAEW